MKTVKKIVCTLMVVIMCLSSAPLQGFVGLEWPNLSALFTTKASAATEYTSGYYTYTISDGKATITYCDWSISGDVVIPDTLGGYPVTSIGDHAFLNCYSLTSITIPDSVICIGYLAFAGCTSLTSITIPDSVTRIGYCTFLSCTSLTSITVDSWNEYYSSDGYGVLFNKDKTTLIQYPIGNSRSSYLIPDSVTSIGDYAFSDCTSLTSITIPDSVTSIGDGTFIACTSLTSITVDSANEYYSSDGYGVLFNKDKTTLIQYPIGNRRSSYSIPDSVTIIGVGAFYYFTSLTSITIPDSVTRIGDYAFVGCKSLTSITIPDSVTSIGEYAFDGCTNLTNVYYTGTKEQWKAIEIGADNEPLLKAADSTGFNGGDPDENNPDDDNPSIKTITGMLEDYKTTTVVIINGGGDYDYVSEITVGGIKYTVKDEDLISVSLAESSLNKRVIIEVENDVVKSFKKYQGSDVDYQPQISCKNTTVKSHKNALLDDNWNTFKIEGEIINFNEYDNLENIWITIKSPDANIVKFDSIEKSEVTFPLGRSIYHQQSDTFKCKAFVNRDYMPEGGSETLAFECILNGELNGKKVEGVYSRFEVKVVNLSYKEEKAKPNKTLRELLEEMRKLVPEFEKAHRADPQKQKEKPMSIAGSGLSYDITAFETALGMVNMSDGLDFAEMAYDLSFYISGMKNPTLKECGKMFFDQLDSYSDSDLDEIVENMRQWLLANEFFDYFIAWYCEEHGIDVGDYTRINNLCPTDIIVTDEFGEVVLKIINDEIVLCADNISADVFESRKTIYLPTDLDYEIKIIATGDGTMDYYVETITEYGERRLIEFNDVPIVKGESYSTIAPTDKSSETAVFNLVSESGNVVNANKEEVAHTFGEYDAKCKDCGFDRTEGCSCNCHKSGIVKFFFNIILFFQRIFKQNKTCACGVNHY